MLVNNLDVSGGYQKLVLRLSRALVERGHEVAIYTGSVNRVECYPELLTGIEVHAAEGLVERDFGRSRLWKIALARVHPLIRFRKVGRMLPRRVDAIIIHDEYSLYALSAMTVPKGVSVVWMLNNELSDGLESLAYRLRQCFPFFGSLREFVMHILQCSASIAEWWNCRSGIRKVDIAAVYDEYNKRTVTKRLGIPAVNVFAGADIEDFRQARRIGMRKAGNAIRLLSVGVMFPHRRYEDLIEAVALAQRRGVNVELTIVGRRDLCPEYAVPVSALPGQFGCADKVTFRDSISTAELRELYRMSDAFAFVNDGLTWGIAVFEAVAADLPVIMTNNIGAADLLVDRRSAWVVGPRQPEQIAAALEEIALKPEMVARVTAEATDKVLPVVSWDAYAERMLDVLRKAKDG